MLDPETTIGEDERELGRFKLKEGAKLRADYPYFLDLTTEYNTWIFAHAEHAGYEQPTLAPAILRYFSYELLKTGTTNAYDLAFAMQGINAERVERNLILHYISSRLGSNHRPGSPADGQMPGTDFGGSEERREAETGVEGVWAAAGDCGLSRPGQIGRIARQEGIR